MKIIYFGSVSGLFTCLWDYAAAAILLRSQGTSSILYCWTSLAFALALALGRPADWETNEILVPEIKKILKHCPIEKRIIIHLFIPKQSAFYSLLKGEDEAQ